MKGRHGCDRIVAGFITTYAISAYHHKSRSGEVYSMEHYVIKVCQLLAAGLWFSLGTPVSSTHKTDRHEITEILLKVAFITLCI